jgi:uncharacterized protein
MEIKQKDNGTKGSFYIEADNKVIAEMTYVWKDENQMIIEHTEVSQEGSGKGLGKQLVAKAVEFARQQSVKIIPVCPFTKKVIEKTPEFQDVLQH